MKLEHGFYIALLKVKHILIVNHIKNSTAFIEKWFFVLWKSEQYKNETGTWFLYSRTKSETYSYCQSYKE